MLARLKIDSSANSAKAAVRAADNATAGNDGLTASIGGIFVRHPRLGIGRRLLAAAEACAQQRGFERLSCCATANAVPFFLRFGYEMASAGVRTLPLNCVLPVTFLRKPLARLRHALN